MSEKSSKTWKSILNNSSKWEYCEKPFLLILQVAKILLNDGSIITPKRYYYKSFANIMYIVITLYKLIFSKFIEKHIFYIHEQIKANIKTFFYA